MDSYSPFSSLNPSLIDDFFNLTISGNLQPTITIKDEYMNMVISQQPTITIKDEYMNIDISQQHSTMMINMMTSDKDRETTINNLSSICLKPTNDIFILMKNMLRTNIFQKLVKVCRSDVREDLFCRLTANNNLFFDVCSHQNGSQSMVKLIKHCQPMSQIQMRKLMHVLRPNLITLSMNANGLKIVQECVFLLVQDEYMVRTIICYVLNLSKNRQGCQIVQQCIDHFGGDAKKLLLIPIIVNALELSLDAFGNYVIQKVLSKSEPDVIVNILARLRGCYAVLSKQKNSSHVVERCLNASTHVSSSETMKIVKELCERSVIVEVMQHNYGNYVMKAMVKVAKRMQRQWPLVYQYVKDAVTKCYPHLVNHMFGRHVLKELARW